MLAGSPHAPAPRAPAILATGRGRPSSTRVAVEPARASRDALEPATILVVDDDEMIRDTLRDVLEREGYRVVTAEHGESALAALASGPPPRVVLVDLMMPVMDGWKLISEMKSRPALCAIPVVVITAGGNHLLARAPVASGYLTKPLDLTRLLQTVTRVCGG